MQTLKLCQSTVVMFQQLQDDSSPSEVWPPHYPERAVWGQAVTYHISPCYLRHQGWRNDPHNCNYTQCMQAQCTTAVPVGSTYHLGWVPDTKHLHAWSNKKTIKVKTTPSSEFISRPYLVGTHIWTDDMNHL